MRLFRIPTVWICGQSTERVYAELIKDDSMRRRVELTCYEMNAEQICRQLTNRSHPDVLIVHQRTFYDLAEFHTFAERLRGRGVGYRGVLIYYDWTDHHGCPQVIDQEDKHYVVAGLLTIRLAVDTAVER